MNVVRASTVLDDIKLAEILWGTQCFCENNKRRNKNLRYIATCCTADPQKVFNCLVSFSARGSRGVWHLIKARRSTGSTVFKVWRGGILAHALRVLLCLHLPVCINQTIINLLCRREGLMKMGFSSSFHCYDMLLLGVEGLCGERHVWWEIFIFLYIYWADQMLWRRVQTWLFCET